MGLEVVGVLLAPLCSFCPEPLSAFEAHTMKLSRSHADLSSCHFCESISHYSCHCSYDLNVHSVTWPLSVLVSLPLMIYLSHILDPTIPRGVYLPKISISGILLLASFSFLFNSSSMPPHSSLTLRPLVMWPYHCPLLTTCPHPSFTAWILCSTIIVISLPTLFILLLLIWLKYWNQKRTSTCSPHQIYQHIGVCAHVLCIIIIAISELSLFHSCTCFLDSITSCLLQDFSLYCTFPAACTLDLISCNLRK